MAGKSYHKTPEERVKTFKEHLESLQHAADFLRNLANHQYDCEHKTADLSLDTLYYFGAIMDMAVDSFSSELGLLQYEGRPESFAYVPKPQAAPEGGA
jgi:hypothetical protein